MARTGLTQAQVAAARSRLLAEGRHPSVDAVRHALGDTGSKSTIHRHLKALAGADDGADDGPADARAATTQALQALVEQVAGRLHADGDARLRALQARHDAALREKEAELARLRGAVALLTARLQRLEGEAAAAPAPAAADPARGARLAGGFGSFDSLALSSRCVGRDISPFGMLRGAARAEVFAFDGAWPVPGAPRAP